MMETNKKILNKVISKNIDYSKISVKMYDPEWDRNVEGLGRIVARGGQK